MNRLRPVNSRLCSLRYLKLTLIYLIIYIQKFLHAHSLRARQLIPNRAESWNWVQKVEIKLIDRKVGKRAKTKWRPLSECLRQQKSSKNITIHEKFDRFNKGYKYINQSTGRLYSTCKRGFTKLLKATKRGFSFATARKEDRLQVWIEVGHFSPNQYNWIRIKAPDNAWQRALQFPSGIWILQSPTTPLCLNESER